MKQSHPLENDEHGSISPRASKKRKIEPEDDDTPFSTQPTRLPHDTAGNQIEEELASALGAGMVDPNERPAENGPSQSENSAESATAPGTGTDIDTDMATVISSIMNHAERVEEQCAMGEQQLSEDTSNQEAPKGVVFVKANSHLKIQSLPILDNLVWLCDLKSIPITECLRDSVSVHANPISACQVFLSRHYLPRFRTRIREWTSLCDHAFPV